jgi:hypothetical protein
VTDQELASVYEDLAAAPNSSRRSAIRDTAERFGVSARRVFDAIEASKNSVE